MPGFLHHPIGRRSFLRYTALGAATLVSACRAGPGPASAGLGAGGEFHLALFSDTHIPADPTDAYRGFKPVDNLRAILPQMLSARPAAAIHCGDAARLEGKPEDYAALKTLLDPLATQMPVSIALGNHDDRGNFRNAFAPGEGPAGKAIDRHILIVEHAVARLVVLDSLLYPNKTPGLLGQAQRNWLSGYLGSQRDRPVVVFVHHTLADSDGDLLDAERLFTLLRPHRHVKAIFYGHSHRWEFLERDRIKLINLPAVGYNFNDQQPVGWVEARFRREGVDLTLHAVGGNRAEDGKTFPVRWG